MNCRYLEGFRLNMGMFNSKQNYGYSFDLYQKSSLGSFRICISFIVLKVKMKSEKLIVSLLTMYQVSFAFLKTGDLGMPSSSKLITEFSSVTVLTHRLHCHRFSPD